MQIVKSGDFWDGSIKPKIILAFDQDIMDVDTSELEGFAEIKREALYNFGDDSNGKENKKKKKLSAGAIAGIVIGCVAFVAIIVVIVVIVVKKKKVSNK